jgi:hypothetical protein
MKKELILELSIFNFRVLDIIVEKLLAAGMIWNL